MVVPVAWVDGEVDKLLLVQASKRGNRSVPQPAVKGDGRAESGWESGPGSPVFESEADENRWRRRKPASLAPQ